ncbi:uncharacterized protein ACBT44_010817 isoform 1-T1 [Syngnathus typhle]
MDELLLLTSRNTDFSRSAALCFVEAWLSERTPHHAVELAGFRLMRADRSAELSGKSKGGGLCFYINERWCTDVTVLKEFCSPLLETLFINCRPFYSPREFSSIVMAAVYIPPHARASEATQMLADQVTDMKKLLPNSLIIVLGDLNKANLAHELPRYRQHVTCPTRGAQTLDHCYTVIKDAYHSAARAALGLSDHCLVHLIPAYRQKLKTSKPVEAAQSQGGGLQERRPRAVQADQKHTEPRVWKGLQNITGYKKQTPRPVESPRLANQLNKFYCRFDRSSHTTGPPAAQSTYSPLPTTALSALQVREEEVRQMFRRQKTRKAPGPDGVSPSCLKVCAEQLAPTFARIFNRSLELCEVPLCFKSSTIVPVAKKPAITGLNDYRPVALTSVVMKSFERLALNHLKDVTGPLLDPLQFAYRANRSVDDAVNMGVRYILHHLDTPGTYARILFVDFSSPFNTITPEFLYLLRQLMKLNLPRELLKTFYTAIIQSVLCTSITVWFGSASKQDKHRLQRTIRTAEKIIGINLPSIQDLYLSRTRNRARNISTDPSHPGCSLFELLPSGRRYRARYAKTSRHRDSFFPQAVALMNSHHSESQRHYCAITSCSSHLFEFVYTVFAIIHMS